MIRELTGLLGAAVERHLRGLLLTSATAVGAALFAAVSLGFGTFALYVHLRTTLGPVVAALIICAAFALLAGATWAIGMSRRRASPGATVAPTPAPLAAKPDPLRAAAAAGTFQEQLALDAAMRLGRELSPMQLLLTAVIAGFITGRSLGK